METSVKHLKERLREFVTDPQSNQEFPAWFAIVLRDAHNSTEQGFEWFAHTVQEAFARAADGEFAPSELRDILFTLVAS